MKNNTFNYYEIIVTNKFSKLARLQTLSFQNITIKCALCMAFILYCRPFGGAHHNRPSLWVSWCLALFLQHPRLAASCPSIFVFCAVLGWAESPIHPNRIHFLTTKVNRPFVQRKFSDFDSRIRRRFMQIRIFISTVKITCRFVYLPNLMVPKCNHHSHLHPMMTCMNCRYVSPVICRQFVPNRWTNTFFIGNAKNRKLF